MAVERGLLLIADIAGYTRFMEFHRTDLAHAQDVVACLLEAVIDAGPALRLVEVEGDAAFMYGQRRETWGVLVRTLPYVLGLRKPCVGFRNLTPA